MVARGLMRLALYSSLPLTLPHGLCLSSRDNNHLKSNSLISTHLNYYPYYKSEYVSMGMCYWREESRLE